MHRRDPEKQERDTDDGVSRKQRLVVYFMAFLMVASVLASLAQYLAD